MTISSIIPCLNDFSHTYRKVPLTSHNESSVGAYECTFGISVNVLRLLKKAKFTMFESRRNVRFDF